jgi:hypothetical protein
MVRSDSEPLGPFVQIDEALVGGKGGPHKELVLVAAEANGRVRLAHVENNDAGTIKRFADGQIADDARIVTDGHAGYNNDSLGRRSHEVWPRARSRAFDPVTLLAKAIRRIAAHSASGIVAPKNAYGAATRERRPDLLATSLRFARPLRPGLAKWLEEPGGADSTTRCTGQFGPLASWNLGIVS